MEIEVLTSLNGTDSLKEQWDKLVTEAANTILSKYDFTKNYGRFYSDLAEPKIYIANADGRIVGIAPLAEENGVLKFATGLDYKTVADYNDFIVHPQYSKEVLNAFTGILKDHRKFKLKEIPETSSTVNYFRDNNIGIINDSEEPSSFITLPQTLEQYDLMLKDSYKKSLKRFNSNFSSVELRSLKNESDLEKWMDDFMDMHQTEWNEKEMSGCFADDEKHTRFRKFHREIARDLFKDGNLELLRLEADGNTVALAYGFNDAETVYNYLGSINLNFKKYSPGRIIGMYWIRDSINKKKRKFDFLRGYEEYKKGFGVTWAQSKTIASDYGQLHGL